MNNYGVYIIKKTGKRQLLLSFTRFYFMYQRIPIIFKI